MLMSLYQIEKTGKTVEDALKSALVELKADENDVTVEVLEEASKGLLGLFGGKEARIKVVLKETADRVSCEFLSNILEKMNLEANVQAKLVDKTLNVTLSGNDLGVLIGKRGQTLDSLQYLLSLVVNKDRHDYLRVVLDTENYREKRKETLERLAHKLAIKAKKLRKDIVLEPMNPYERRIIHSALQNNPSVSTRSEGEEPYRKVIIFLNR